MFITTVSLLFLKKSILIEMNGDKDQLSWKVKEIP